MNQISIHGLILLAGALGCAALAGETSDSPTRELLASYLYQPEVVSLPPPPLPTAANPAVFEPTVTPDFEMQKPPHYDWQGMEQGMAWDQARQSHALYTRDWHWNTQWQILGRPDVHRLNIPWSPMTTPTDATLSPASADAAMGKLHVRVPLVSFLW